MILLLERAWGIVVHNRWAYLILNFFYYGLIVLLMAYAAFNLPLQEQVLQDNARTYFTGALALDGRLASAGEILTLLGYTFLSNLLGASYGGITLPSFFIPFAGVFLGLFRAAQIGLVFSPFNPAVRPLLLPHLPTLLIEGQASVLAMLGAYIQGRALIWPGSIGQSSRWRAFVEGVRQSGTIYMFIMPVLLISALYGVIEMALVAR